MAHSVKFDGCNKTYGPPAGVTEEQCATIGVFTNGACIVSAWKLTPEELAEINRTGLVWQSIWANGLPPSFIGSETVTHALVADFGAVWPLSGDAKNEPWPLYRYQHTNYIAGGGYLVYRAVNGEDLNFSPSRPYLENHKQAMFVTEAAAKDYCRYRNTMLVRNGSDELPTYEQLEQRVKELETKIDEIEDRDFNDSIDRDFEF